MAVSSLLSAAPIVLYPPIDSDPPQRRAGQTSFRKRTHSSLTNLKTYTYDRIVEDARKPMAYRMLMYVYPGAESFPGTSTNVSTALW